MRSPVSIIIIVLTAFIACTLSLSVVLEGTSTLSTSRVGAWSFNLDYGSEDADPYARVMLAVNGDFPLGRGEGVELLATQDDNGGRLDLSCSYTLAGGDLPGKLWTLALYDAAGHILPNALERFGYHAHEVLRDADGGFRITLGAHPAAGNWLPTPVDGSGSFVLVLRLYGLEEAAREKLFEERIMTLARNGCRS